MMILIVLVQLIVLFVNVVLKENLLNIFYYVVSDFKMPEISWSILLMRSLTCQHVKDVVRVVRESTVGTNVHRCYKEWRQWYKGRTLFLKPKSSFSFTVTLTNIRNYPSQFPRLLRFVSTRMLYWTEVFTWVLYFVFYHFEFLLSWKVAQNSRTRQRRRIFFTYLHKLEFTILCRREIVYICKIWAV